MDILSSILKAAPEIALFTALALGRVKLGASASAALSAVKEETERMTPVPGFTVTYATSNVILVVWHR